MSDSKKITLCDLKNQYRMGLRIPEIQRDYVMGAGGKDGEGKDKLDKLLNAILSHYNENKSFDLSCIITYCSDAERKPLEIYDGQQRLTTLLIFTLFKMRKEDIDVSSFAEWYSFAGRPKANEIFALLTGKELDINNIVVTDFTSFSIKNLLKKISLSKYKDISSDYLFKNVKFDMVSIGSQNEIEQLFMDLNAGVKLKDYELYKAKLTYHIGQLKFRNENDLYQESLEMWPHKMDNDWLDFFDIFADYEHPAEEYETEFAKYCINMISTNTRTGTTIIAIERITADVIKQVYDIMQMVTKLNLRVLEKNSNLCGLLCFSWGKCDSEILKSHNYDMRGSFWNLSFENHEKMLNYVIKTALLDTNKRKELNNDVLLWCFITTLDWDTDVQNEYLRLVKILLNHNVAENKDAWYECQNIGQYLYYCKYTVYGIPQYYGEHIDSKTTNDDIKQRHSNMFLFNKWVIQSISISNMLNRKEVTNTLMKQINNVSMKDIVSIINFRIQLLEKYKCYEEYKTKENDVFGIIEKIQTPVKEGYYLENVNFSWPTSGRGKKSTLEDCLVLLKCSTDLLFSQFNNINDELVKKIVMMGNEYIDKYFWNKKQNTVHKLIDRVTPTSTTYNKKDSDRLWIST